MAGTAELALLITAKDEASKTLRDVGGASDGLGSKLGSMGKVAIVAGLALAGGLAAGLVSAVKAAGESQLVMAQTEAVIKSTGGAAGFSATQISDMATQLSQVAPFDDEVIQRAENMLLTFTNIGHDVMPMATAAVLDMATALGEDTQTAAVQLGKALNDPVEGVTALQRVGVKLTDSQKDLVKSLVDVGDVAGAQAVILGELQKEFGGSAEAAGKTFAGQLTILKTQLGNVQEAIGMALIPVLLKLIPYLTNAADWFGKHLPRAIEIVTGFIDGVVGKFKEFIDALRGHDWAGAAGMIRDGIVKALSGLKDIGVKVLGWLVSAIAGIDYSSIGTALKTGITGALFKIVGWGGDVVKWVFKALSGVGWSTVATTIKDGILSGLTTLTGWGVDLVTWVYNSIAGVDWSGVAGTIASGISAGLGAVADFGAGILTSLTTSFQNADWSDIGTSVLDGILGGLTALTGWGTDLVTWFYTAIVGVDWANVALAVRDGIVNGVLALVGWGASLVTWVYTAITGVDWATVGTAIKDGVVGAVTTLIGWGQDLVTWIYTTLQGVDWSTVGQTIKDGIAGALALGVELYNAIVTAAQGGDPSGANYVATGHGIGINLGTGLESGLQESQKNATFWETYKTNAENNLNKVGLDVAELATGIGSAMTGIGGALQAASPEFEKMALLAGAALYGLLLAAKEVISGVSGLLSALLIVVGYTFTGMGIAINFMNDTVLPNLATAVSDTVTAVEGFFSELFTAVSIVWDAATGIPGTIATALQVIRTAFDTVFVPIQGVVSDVLSTIVGLVDTLWVTGAVAIITKAIDTAKGYFDTGFVPIQGVVEGVFNTIKATISRLWNSDAVGLIRDGISAMSDAFTNAAGSFVALGTALIDGVKQGVLDAARALAQAAIDVVKGALDAAKSFLHISSPSQVMHDEVGVPISMGIAGGILAGAPAIMGAVGQVISAALTTAAALMSGPGYGGGQSGGGPLSTNPATLLQTLAASQQSALMKLNKANQQLQEAMASGNAAMIAQMQYVQQQSILAYQQALAAYQAAVLAGPGGAPGSGPGYGSGGAPGSGPGYGTGGAPGMPGGGYGNGGAPGQLQPEPFNPLDTLPHSGPTGGRSTLMGGGKGLAVYLFGEKVGTLVGDYHAATAQANSGLRAR